MTTIIKASGPARFLSLVPHLLGFAPTRSLVLVPFAGRRSIGAMRFDLPSAADSEEIDRIAATCIGMVCRISEADAVAIVAYVDADLRDDPARLPRRDFVDAITRRADTCGIELRDALCVGEDAWASYLDAATPPALGDLADLRPREDARLPRLGPGDQESGARLPRRTDADAARTARALEAVNGAVRFLRDVTTPDAERPGAAFGPAAIASARREVVEAGTRMDAEALAAACRLSDPPELFESALAWTPTALPPFDAAMLIWCLSRPALRDIALVQWSGEGDDGDAALDAQLRWEDGEEYPEDLAMRMWGDGPRPSGERLTAALELTRHVAALAPDAERAGPLAACAWLSWALGRSTHADSYARRACELEPEHGLSEIVRSFVSAGHLPDWAFRPDERAVARRKGRRR